MLSITSPVLVTFAVADESRVFLRRLSGTHRSGTYTFGAVGHRPVAVLHTGMGERAAERAVLAALDALAPARVISSGFAGGLAPDLATGQIVAAANFSDPTWLASLPATVRRVQTACSELPLDDPAGKAAFAARTGAECVDLESTGIARACAARQCHLGVLRVISDAAAESLPLPSTVAYDFERLRIRIGSILWHLVTHPGKIPKLIRFMSAMPGLQEVLADHLTTIIREEPR